MGEKGSKVERVASSPSDLEARGIKKMNPEIRRKLEEGPHRGHTFNSRRDVEERKREKERESPTKRCAVKVVIRGDTATGKSGETVEGVDAESY